MALILNIESSTTNCSVSIGKAGECIALKEYNNAAYSHSEKLHSFIKQTLEEAQLTLNDLDAIAVSSGPGSYTGLRIGTAAAKGLSFALQIPLLSTDTLHALSLQHQAEQGYIVPLLDARRMEVYSAVYDNNHKQVREVQSEVISADAFKTYLEKGRVFFLGPGAEKCAEVILHPNAHFGKGYFPSSAEGAILSEVKYKAADFEDVAYFEPFYLKDFVAGK